MNRRGGDGGLAALPMYDRPEIRAETDALWSAIRDRLREAGIDAPEALERRRAPRLVWSAPEMVVSQTCGLPYVSALAGRVGLLGAPSYALPGCPPGHYRSALVVPAASDAAGLSDLRGARAAVNARDSQSGYGALMVALAPHALDGRFLSDWVPTGSHAASMAAVAEGRAGIAAIDAVTWTLAERHEPGLTGRLRAIGWTEPTPGLPFITGRRRQADAIAAAVRAAIAGLDSNVAAALLIEGFQRFRPEDYAPIRTRLAAAQGVHALPTPPPA